MTSEQRSAETWTIHVCRDCRQLAHTLAHSPGSLCGTDQRRTWSGMTTVEVAPLERAERAEAAARAFAEALNQCADGWPRPNWVDRILASHPDFLRALVEERR